MSSENNKRIAKNTIFLYIRMLLIMGVTLYSSRIVLSTLGVVDFGIYNVVGGIVTMLGFLNLAMAGGTQRFLSVELGKQNQKKLNEVFWMSLNIHVLIALVIFILSETIGLWFFYTKLNIPIARMNAALWVYQISILSFMVSIIQTPYNATIIAHEQMKIYAFVSIIDATLKLLILFILMHLSFDKLKLYALLMLAVTIIIALVYRCYGKIKFEECKYKLFWDKRLFKVLISFSSWNLFGGMSMVVFNQGINMLLNIFFGPAINAARGVANQVNIAISTFVGNFQLAVNPQIMKSYASNNHEYMLKLIYLGSRVSFFLSFVLALPVLLNMEFIFNLWLESVPDYTIIFCRLIIINSLIDCLSGASATAVQATGAIKQYQLIIGSLIMLNLPISYIVLKVNPNPELVFYVSISISILALICRLWILNKLIHINLHYYFEKIILVAILISFSALILPLLICHYTNLEGFVRFVFVCLTCFFSSFLSIYIIGLSIQERRFCKTKIIYGIKFLTHL